MKESKYHTQIGEEGSKDYTECGGTDTELYMYDEVYMGNETSEKREYEFCSVLDDEEEFVEPDDALTQEDIHKFYEEKFQKTKDEWDRARRTRSNSD